MPLSLFVLQLKGPWNAKARWSQSLLKMRLKQHVCLLWKMRRWSNWNLGETIKCGAESQLALSRSVQLCWALWQQPYSILSVFAFKAELNYVCWRSPTQMLWLRVSCWLQDDRAPSEEQSGAVNVFGWASSDLDEALIDTPVRPR